MAEGIIESIGGMDGGVDELLTGPEFQWLGQTDGEATLLWSSRYSAVHVCECACVRVCAPFSVVLTHLCMKIDDDPI